MNILITGAGGFIGQRFLQALRETSHNVYALCYQAEEGCFEEVKDVFVRDITESFQIPGFFDCVFHLAACNLTNVGGSDYEAYHRINVQGTEHVIKAMKTKHFVFMSTALVYRREGGAVDENSSIEPSGDYAKSKWEAEELCRQYFSENQLTIFRPVNIVGPGQAEKAVIPVFFQKALHNENLELIHPKDTLLQFLYVDDVIGAFQRLLKRNHGCGIVNLAPNVSIALWELAEAIVKQTKSSSEICYLREGKAVQSQILAQKAKDVLGWQAQILPEEIIQNYHKNL